jgi:hypothetical protein
VPAEKTTVRLAGPYHFGTVERIIRDLDVLFAVDAHGVEMEESFQRKKAIGFRECRHFDSTDNYPAVRAELADLICEHCAVDRVARSSLHIALDEICENVLFHASTDHGGFAAAQALRSKPLMEVAIADVGIGIRASLTRTLTTSTSKTTSRPSRLRSNRPSPLHRSATLASAWP